MSEIPKTLKYNKSHEWVRRDHDNVATIGITKHAQELLGDMVFVEMPEPKQQVAAGDEVGVLESVKAASDLYAPLSGEVVAVNDAVVDSPALVNTDPYGEGWLFKLSVHSDAEFGRLLDATEYAQLVTEED